MTEKVTPRDKECLMVQEMCEALADRSRDFLKALQIGDESAMYVLFALEQLEHFKLMSDIVNDFEVKTMLMEHALEMEQQVSESIRRIGWKAQ